LKNIVGIFELLLDLLYLLTRNDGTPILEGGDLVEFQEGHLNAHSPDFITQTAQTFIDRLIVPPLFFETQLIDNSFDYLLYVYLKSIDNYIFTLTL
jgi:hypothetical protein